MLVGYELGKSLDELSAMGKEEIGWWLAFLTQKNYLEEKASKAASKR